MVSQIIGVWSIFQNEESIKRPIIRLFLGWDDPRPVIAISQLKKRAIVILENGHDLMVKVSLRFECWTTNNQAVHEFVIVWMVVVEDMGANNMKIGTNFQLVIYQINGGLRIKSHCCNDAWGYKWRNLQSSIHLKSLTSPWKRTLGPTYFSSWQAPEDPWLIILPSNKHEALKHWGPIKHSVNHRQHRFNFLEAFSLYVHRARGSLI